MNAKKTSAKDKLFTKVAKEHLCIDTLEVRNRDSLDFHDCGVRGLKSAFENIWQHQENRIKKLRKTIEEMEATYNGCDRFENSGEKIS